MNSSGSSLFRRVRQRGVPARVSSLLMLFQRSPLAPLLPEARVISTTGFTEALRWTITAVAGLGAWDAVSGASAITQIVPVPGSSTVPGVAGDNLNFVFQATGIPDGRIPSYYEVTGILPPGLVQAGRENSTIDIISGIPSQAGTYAITLTAWEFPNRSGNSASSPFTFNIVNPPLPAITAQPAGGTFAEGAFVNLVAGNTAGRTFTWSRDDEELGAGETILFARDAVRRFVVPAADPGTAWRTDFAFNDAAWTGVPGAIGYDTSTAQTDYRPHIAGGGNTQSLMLSKSPVAHLRMPFTLPPGAVLSFLKLRVQCDDGFVAWLNGTEVAAQNKPAALTWNSTASGEADDKTAITFREIDLSQHLGLLQNGNNLLAVQAMNRTTSSTDFLFNCELAAGVNATNSARLMLTALQLNQSGIYRVRVANPAGEVTSDDVPVLIAPSIFSQPESVTIASGETAALFVTPAGTPPFSYQWYRGQAGDTSSPVADATEDAFTTPPLTETTSYWVRVTTPAGAADSTTATVTVTPNLTPPVITAHPASIAIENGSSVQLSVTATGSPPITYQWYRGPSGDTADAMENATASLFTTPVLTETTRFWVRVTNAVDSVDSDAAVITVNIAPADPYLAWRMAQFSGADAQNPEISGPEADADKDGLTNATEYVFGTPPRLAAAPPTLALSVADGRPSLSFTATRSTGPGYNDRTRLYTLESAAHPGGPWTPVDGFTDLPASDQTVTFTPAAGTAAAFYRLRVRLLP